MTPRLVVRSGVTRGAATALSAVALLLVVIGVSLMTTVQGGGHHRAGVGLFLLLFGALLFSLAIGRIGRMGVLIGGDRVVVRNWFRSRTLKREDIDHFQPGYRMTDLSVRELFSSPSLQTYVGGVNTIFDLVDRCECAAQTIEVVGLVEPLVIVPDCVIQL